MTTSYESPKASIEYNPLVENPELRGVYEALLNGLVERLEPFCKPELTTIEAKDVTFGTASDGALDVFRITHNGIRRSDVTFTGKEQENRHCFKVSLAQGENETNAKWFNQLTEKECSSRQILEMLVQEWPHADTEFSLGKIREILYDRDIPVTPEHIFGLLDMYTELHTDSGIRTNGMQWTAGESDSIVLGKPIGVQAASLSAIETNGTRLISMDTLIAKATPEDENAVMTCHTRCDSNGNITVTADYVTKTGEKVVVPVDSHAAVLKQLIDVSENMLGAKMLQAMKIAHATK